MYPPGHYQSMTDDQLAQYDQQARRIEQLERELALAKTMTDDMLAAAEAERAKQRAELIARADLIIKLTGQVHDRTMHTRRTAAANIVLTNALEELLQAVTSPAVLAHQAEWPGEVHRALEHAQAVWLKHRFPF